MQQRKLRRGRRPGGPRQVLVSWVLALALLLPPVSVLAATQTAQYQVTFDALWSAATHPTDIPPDPHFSPLVGATHQDSVAFWTPGGIATDGIERMAERGMTGRLVTEIEAVIPGQADQVLLGSGIDPSPGSTSISFTAQQAHPVLTLVSMVAPSPDWFVGVDRFVLFDGAEWVTQATVELFVYDAGTDSGTSFTAPDANTSPQEPITLKTGLPFSNPIPFGTFTITRTDAPVVPALPVWGIGSLVTAMMLAAAARTRRMGPRGCKRD